MNTTIEHIKEKAATALQSWVDSKIDNLVNAHPNLAVASVYLKRGMKNCIIHYDERINSFIDKMAMFICDEDGNINIDTVFSDLMSAFANMPEQEFRFGFVNGTLGKGVIRIILPQNLFARLLFSDIEAIRITKEDLLELKTVLL